MIYLRGDIRWLQSVGSTTFAVDVAAGVIISVIGFFLILSYFYVIVRKYLITYIIVGGNHLP